MRLESEFRGRAGRAPVTVTSSVCSSTASSHGAWSGRTAQSQRDRSRLALQTPRRPRESRPGSTISPRAWSSSFPELPKQSSRVLHASRRSPNDGRPTSIRSSSMPGSAAFGRLPSSWMDSASRDASRPERSCARMPTSTSSRGSGATSSQRSRRRPTGGSTRSTSRDRKGTRAARARFRLRTRSSACAPPPERGFSVAQSVAGARFPRLSPRSRRRGGQISNRRSVNGTRR